MCHEADIFDDNAHAGACFTGLRQKREYGRAAECVNQ
jgi:hypothetical protein